MSCGHDEAPKNKQTNRTSCGPHVLVVFPFQPRPVRFVSRLRLQLWLVMGPLTALPFLAVLPIVALICTLLRRLARFLHLYAPRALISPAPAHAVSTTSATATPASQPTSLPVPASAAHPKPTWGAGAWTALPGALAARVPIPSFILARTLPRVPWTRLPSEVPEQELDTSNSSVSKRTREGKAGIELGILPTSALPPPPSALPLASPPLIPASPPPLIPVSPPRTPAPPPSAPPYATTFVREQDTGTLVDVSISPFAAGPSSAPLYPQGYPYGSPLVPTPAAEARPAQAAFFPAPIPHGSPQARRAFRPASPAEMLTRLSTTPPPPPHRRSRSLGGVTVRRLSGGSKSSGLRNGFSDTDTDNEHEMDSTTATKWGHDRSKEGVLIDISPSPSSTSLEEGGESATSTTSRDITLVVPALQKRVRAPLKPVMDDGIRLRNIQMKMFTSGSTSTSVRETQSPVGMLVDVGDSVEEQKQETTNIENQVNDEAWRWFVPSASSTDPWAGGATGKMQVPSFPPMALPSAPVWTVPASASNSAIPDTRGPIAKTIATPLGVTSARPASQPKPKRKLDDLEVSIETSEQMDNEDEEDLEHTRKRIRGRLDPQAMSIIGVASSGEDHVAPSVDNILDVEDETGQAQDALTTPVQVQIKQERRDEKDVEFVSVSGPAQTWDAEVSAEDPFADPVIDSVHDSVTPSWGGDSWRWSGGARADEGFVVPVDDILASTSFNGEVDVVLETDVQHAPVEELVQAQDPFADPVLVDTDAGLGDVEMGTGSWDVIALEEGAPVEASMSNGDDGYEVADEQNDSPTHARHEDDGDEDEDGAQAILDVDMHVEDNNFPIPPSTVEADTLLTPVNEDEDHDTHANANPSAFDEVKAEVKDDLHDTEEGSQACEVMKEVMETEVYPDPDLLPLPDTLVPAHVTPTLAITLAPSEWDTSLPSAPVPLSPVPVSPTVSVPYPQPVSQTPTPPASPPPSETPVRVVRALAMEGLVRLDLKESIREKEKKQNEDEKENAPPARLALPPSISRSPSTSSLSPSGQSTRPAWSRRADAAAPLGLTTIISTGAVRAPLADASFSTNTQNKLATVIPDDAKSNPLLTPPEQKEEGHAWNGDEEKKPALAAPTVNEHVPGAFYDSPTVSTSADAAPTATKDAVTSSTSSLATTSQTSSAAPTNKRPNPHTWVLPSPARLAQSSPLELALAMQLRPGLGAGADPAWMVRFLMAVYGWVVVSVAGGF